MDADPGRFSLLSIYLIIFDHVDGRSRHFFTSLYNVAVKDENPTRILFCASWSPMFLTSLLVYFWYNCPWSRLGLSGNVRYGITSFSSLLFHQSTIHLRVASETLSISCIWSEIWQFFVHLLCLQVFCSNCLYHSHIEEVPSQFQSDMPNF
jgi:hypothetical protein